MGIQTSLDALQQADRVVDAMRLADDLAFESSRDPGVRTLRILDRTLAGDDQLAAIAAVHALAQVFDEQAARTLTAQLSSERSFLREHAAWALGVRLPRLDAVGRLIGMVVEGAFLGMVAQRTLEQWAVAAPENLVVGLESALLGIDEPDARARLVETLGLVRTRIAERPLLKIARDSGEQEVVRVAAAAALGQRPGRPDVEATLSTLAAGDGYLADIARLALVDLAAEPAQRDAGRGTESDRLTIAQLFLHADIDADLSEAGAGDNGGIATLLVRLGDALVAAEPGADRVITMSRGSVEESIADLETIRQTREGHVYGRVPVAPEPVPSASAWPLRVAARRGIRRILRAAGEVDMIHLRMADVGSLAAADVARELDVPVIFTVAPDPHAVIRSLDLSGRLSRWNFGEVDESEHFWFRARLVQQLAANASHTVLFPRPELKRDMRELVGIDIEARPERHTVVPEGVDIEVLDRATAEAEAQAVGAEPSPALAALRELLETLPAERRGLPLVVSVGRFHRVKGMAALVEAWSLGDLRDRANLLLIGGDLASPSPDEREQLDVMDAIVSPDDRLAAGLLLPGHQPNDVVARWVAAVRTGIPGLAAPRGIYACGSLKEEFGIALLEAMASGLVVVAPDGGGPATYVENGVTGYLTATWDVARLADAMLEAFDAAQAESGDERAERSRRTVEASFTIQRMAQTLVPVYAQVAADERELNRASLSLLT